MKTPITDKEDLSLGRKKLRPFILSPTALPVKYTIGDMAYTGMPENSTMKRKENKKYSQIVYTAETDGLILTADCRMYKHFAAVEWTLTFTNPKGNKPVRVSGVDAVNLVFEGKNGVIYTCNGDFYSLDGYVTTPVRLLPGEVYEEAPQGGRPCDRAFPYQRLTFDGFGFNIAIGWPGQWSCRYANTGTGISFTAGQQVFDAVIDPGETARTPLIAIVGFTGEYERGINVWRRWYLENVMPHAHGEIIKPFFHGSYAPPGTVEFSEATEENQLEHLRFLKEHEVGINLWWVDAGWYECKNADGIANWWLHVGNWKYDRSRFPRGLAPIGDECKKNDIAFLMWYESERVVAGSPVVSEHPEWLIKAVDERGRVIILLNLGIKECCEWLAKTIGDSLIENRVNIYRQDFNIEPLENWRRNETPDRIGMVENLYIQGYLHFWDKLRERIPDLIIDSCASGGRRNDLETMRRAVVMHQTDAGYGNHPVTHAFFHTLYTWIPYFRGFCDNWEAADGSYITKKAYCDLTFPVDNFQLFASFAPMMSIDGYTKHIKNFTKEQIAQIANAGRLFYRIAATLETADFYALTPFHKERTLWTVWQFDKPEEKSGIFEVIRNNAAKEEALRIFPKVFESGNYEFTNAESGESFTVSAKTLISEGIVFQQPLRSISFWEYRIRQ